MLKKKGSSNDKVGQGSCFDNKWGQLDPEKRTVFAVWHEGWQREFLLPRGGENGPVNASKGWTCYKKWHDPRHHSQGPASKSLKNKVFQWFLDKTLYGIWNVSAAD